MPTVSVLPSDVIASTSAPATRRLLRLPNPRTGLAALYLPYQRATSNKWGILEAQHVAPDQQRSWFIGDSAVEDGKLLLFSPIDPVLLLIPVLEATTTSPPRFCLPDQIFSTAAALPLYALPAPTPASEPDAKQKGRGTDDQPEESDDVLHLGSIPGLDAWLRKVCDVQPIGDHLEAYRLSMPLVLAYLRRKVVRMAAEESFARYPALSRALARDGLGELRTEDELAKGGSETVSRTAAAVALQQEARLSHALQLLQPYLLPDHLAALTASFSSSSASEPFPLYAAHLQSINPTSSSISSVPPPLPIKPSAAAQAAAAKKRKPSQGVAKLAKADTKGMSKISSFFKPKAPAGSTPVPGK